MTTAGNVRTALKNSRMVLPLTAELPPLPSQCFPLVAAQFRLQPRQPVSFAATFVAALRTNRNAARSVIQDRGTHSRNRSLHPHSPGQRLAFSVSLPSRLQLLLDGLADSTTRSPEGTRRSYLEERFARSKQRQRTPI